MYLQSQINQYQDNYREKQFELVEPNRQIILSPIVFSVAPLRRARHRLRA